MPRALPADLIIAAEPEWPPLPETAPMPAEMRSCDIERDIELMKSEFTPASEKRALVKKWAAVDSDELTRQSFEILERINKTLKRMNAAQQMRATREPVMAAPERVLELERIQSEQGMSLTEWERGFKAGLLLGLEQPNAHRHPGSLPGLRHN